jgi:hypothetical protein
MHDDARRHDDAKKKITNNSNIGFSWVITIDTTNKGSRPEIHDKAGGEELGKLSVLHALS